MTAIIEKEGDGYVSLCSELDIASQGDTISETKNNLQEALELSTYCGSISLKTTICCGFLIL